VIGFHADGAKRALGKREMGLLVIAGLDGYTVAQGFQFVGLFYLPAVTTSVLLNFNPIFVLVIGVVLLGEGASAPRW
jgi:drug/metabolite transporter (DMT)-like permease